MSFSTVREYGLSMFFPKRCTYCGKVILPKEALCEACTASLPTIPIPSCSFCGAAKEDCACQHKKHYYKEIAAPFYYEGAIEKAIHRLKFENKDFLAEDFAKDMAKAIEAKLPVEEIETITFIPFSKKQQRKRMYNPSQMLAESVGALLQIPTENLLYKLYETKTQHTLQKEARSGNVLGAYDVINPKEVEGKTILLIDDIKTTGATLNECAKMLMLCDAKEVYACTFAITKQRKNEK